MSKPRPADKKELAKILKKGMKQYKNALKGLSKVKIDRTPIRHKVKKKLQDFTAQILLLLFMFGVFVAAITSLLVIFSIISGIAWLLGMHPVSLFLFDVFRGGM